MASKMKFYPGAVAFIEMKSFIVIFIVLSVGLLISCSDSSSTVTNASKMEPSISSSIGRADDYAIAAAPAYASSPDTEAYSSSSSESRIQINGNLSLEVQNVSVAMEDKRTLVNQYGGSITSSDSGDSYNRYANISVLVPRESFYELIEAIRNIASKVTNENINSNDVTEEFVDIKARLNVMKQTENRFISLLSETTAVEEIMSVERELMRLRGEIDSLEGRMKYLSKTTDNSVLNVHITEEVSITGSDWSFFDSLGNSVRSFVSFSKHIADFSISLIVFSPIIIGVGLLFFFGYKSGKRYIHRRGK